MQLDFTNLPKDIRIPIHIELDMTIAQWFGGGGKEGQVFPGQTGLPLKLICVCQREGVDQQGRPRVLLLPFVLPFLRPGAVKSPALVLPFLLPPFAHRYAG